MSDKITKCPICESRLQSTRRNRRTGVVLSVEGDVEFYGRNRDTITTVYCENGHTLEEMQQELELQAKEAKQITEQTTIHTYIRRQYSRNDFNSLGYRDHRLWTIEGLPKWVGECNAPLIWGDAFVGEGEDLPTMDFLRPLFARHMKNVPDGCNHVSVQNHVVATADLPTLMAETVALIG